MMYTRSQNYTNMVVGEHEIQTFRVVVVVMLILLLSFDVFVLTSAHPPIIFGKVVCPNILECRLDFCQVKMLMMYNVQTTNLTFVGKKMRSTINNYSIA